MLGQKMEAGAMVNSPEYIAFRLPDGDGLLTVVAALEPGERGSFPWAKWYSESAPSGEFRKVPGGYARFAINDAVASTMIDAIRTGRSLPDQLIEQLPICWGPESPLYPSEYECGRRGAR
jgi:hypothetical protein